MSPLIHGFRETARAIFAEHDVPQDLAQVLFAAVLKSDTEQVEIAILRLAGVNTPEKRGRGVADCEKWAGQTATVFTRKFLRGARTVTVSGVRPGKYAGRMLGSIQADGRYLERALLNAGHAKPYHGGKRQPWCRD